MLERLESHYVTFTVTVGRELSSHEHRSFLRGVSASDHKHRCAELGVSFLIPNLGMILLAAWLILFGILSAPFLGIRFNYSGDILAVFAIVTGVALLIKR